MMKIFEKERWFGKRERLGLKRKKEVSEEEEEEEGEVGTYLTGAVHGENDSTCA
jgi:hypothetical protein